MQSSYLDYRWKDCNKLLFKGILIDSEIDVRCRRYSSMNRFRVEPVSAYTCFVVKDCPNRVTVDNTSWFFNHHLEDLDVYYHLV